MKTNNILFRSGLFLFAFMVCSPMAQATCFKVEGVGEGNNKIPQKVKDMGYDAREWGGGVGYAAAAKLSFGTIGVGIGANSLAPAGTLLGTAYLPFLEKALRGPYTANQIVYKCALSDADNLYEMFSLAAIYGPAYGATAVSDVEGAYQTPARNIAYRITHMKSGRYYTSEWQERKLSADDYIVIDSMLYIPATAFSDATFKLFKTNDFFGNYARDIFKQASAEQGYVALRTSTINTHLVTGQITFQPTSGYASAVWSMKNGETNVVEGKSCRIKEFKPIVDLPTITVADLSNGATSSANFNVAIDCDEGAVSGTEHSLQNPPVAIGFLVNQATRSQSVQLGLQTSSNGFRYLLDNNYGAKGVASGVGIRIYSGSQALNLLSSRGITTGLGHDAGWYGFEELMSSTGNSSNGGKTYEGAFTASLERISGDTLKEGSVYAQAEIIVNLQ
ncbi:fimbrial protein [Pantoea anthophila]|uniref:fimbrial protein n=1 Tax=Pantoea anthophila TaxID=470931 RepID=UPI002DBD1F88|nr:fimbrial protein [Pantoea anthophila]MEB7540289.1 fimbrial protein [Pantoea anthophila]